MTIAIPNAARELMGPLELSDNVKVGLLELAKDVRSIYPNVWEDRPLAYLYAANRSDTPLGPEFTVTPLVFGQLFGSDEELKSYLDYESETASDRTSALSAYLHGLSTGRPTLAMKRVWVQALQVTNQDESLALFEVPKLVEQAVTP